MLIPKWLDAVKRAQAAKTLGYQPINSTKYLTSVGKGAYGTVYEGTPGSVVKFMKGKDKEQVLREADVQSLAYELGIAPRVDAVYTHPSKIQPSVHMKAEGVDQLYDAQIVMKDLRKNYMPLTEHLGSKSGNFFDLTNDLNSVKYRAYKLAAAQQMAKLNQAGYKVQDRHGGNVLIHKRTKEPIQLDFGYTRKLDKADKIDQIANEVKDGMYHAGLIYEGIILKESVYDLMSRGQINEAEDVALQGLAMLNKIKQPLKEYAPTLLKESETLNPNYFGTETRALNKWIKGSGTLDQTVGASTIENQWNVYNTVKEHMNKKQDILNTSYLARHPSIPF